MNFVILTKEYYSDGEKCEFETLIAAKDIEEAKFKALVYNAKRNLELEKFGKSYIMNVINVIDYI